MKKAVYLLLLLFISISKLVYPHGLGTHAAHLQKIIDLNLPDSYLEIINNPTYKPYFIYGSIFPDIQYAANFKSSLVNLYQEVEDFDGVEGLTYEIPLDQIPDINTKPYPFGIDTHNDKYGMAFAE